MTMKSKKAMPIQIHSKKDASTKVSKRRNHVSITPRDDEIMRAVAQMEIAEVQYQHPYRFKTYCAH